MYAIKIKGQITFYFLVLILFTTISCGEKRQVGVVQALALVPDTVLSGLNDSTFITPNIKCMAISVNGKIHYTDYAGEMVVLDTCYNLVSRIGARGQGPGEFMGAAHFYLGNNDSIYILNEGKRAIEVFHQGDCKQTIHFPESIRFTFNTRFFAQEGYIYHSVIEKEAPVFMFGGDEPRFLCSYAASDDPTFGRHATKHVTKGDNCFFLIGCAYPVLQQYSLQGKLLQEYDLSIVPEIRKMIEVYQRTTQNPGSYFTIIQDVYYADNHLYVLIGTREQEKYFCHDVAVFYISESEMKHTATYRLSGNVYDSFCIGGAKLYAHNASKSSIDVFTY